MIKFKKLIFALFLMESSPVIFDLHIHSKYSRATSKDLTLENLSYWAKVKGISILGTGDFTHPLWLKELKEKLSKTDREGIFEYDVIQYILQTEVNNVFEIDGKTRKVHNLIIAKSFDEVDKINEIFSKYGNLEEDGRPTLTLSCEEMMELFEEESLLEDVFIIPAHAWTPWFGIYGSKSGFDSLEECFGSYAKYIFAIETGLSSDPDMNAMVGETRHLSLVSNSDAHSYWPWRLGREANIFYGEDYDYYILFDAVKQKKITTVEVDPSYGKYHYDGHRKCNICLHPKDAIKMNNTCPVCGKKLTLGVLHRVYDLSGKFEGDEKHEEKFYRLLPLHEILSLRFKSTINSKKIWSVYNDLIQKFNNEYNILIFGNLNEIEDKELRNLLIRNRNGEIQVKPGCDGMYGVPLLDHGKNFNTLGKQKNLFEFR